MQFNYLTSIKDKLGMAAEEITLPATIVTVDDLLNWFLTRGEEFKKIFIARDRIYVAGDGKLLHHHETVSNCKNLTFFMPIVGG